MKKFMVPVLLLSLLIFMGGCGETNDEEDLNNEELSQGENSEDTEEPEEVLEGLAFVIQALEEGFTVTSQEPTAYEMLGATEGVVLRIGRDAIELYEFDPDEEGDTARENIQSALENGNIIMEGMEFSAVYNENRNVMLVDYEDHPQGIEIKEAFENM